MVIKKSQHTSVSMSNKLFVIGGYKNTNCAVFDSFSRKLLVSIQCLDNMLLVKIKILTVD